jgi:hypothetical protein
MWKADILVQTANRFAHSNIAIGAETLVLQWLQFQKLPQIPRRIEYESLVI